MGNRRPFFEVKRQFERVHFEHPIPGTLGGHNVWVLDLAIGGARLLGGTRVIPGGPAQELRIDWEEKSIRLKCAVTRCALLNFATGNEKSTYDIGIRLVEALGDSDRVVRELIGYYVMKALDEQRANWEGKPPIGPYVHLEGKSGRYRRCELVQGEWRVSATTRPEQPLSGFTVSAEVPPHYLDLLCETYEKTDDEGRRLTRILAELSINKAEGVPTRRYVP